jgi:hypothetical protein
MSVTYDPHREITISGLLTNTSGPLANHTIDLTGVVNGRATTNAQGNYSVTLAVSRLGEISAFSADGQSNSVQATLTSQVPTISNFEAVCEGGGIWMFTGTVTGAPTQGEVVNFGNISALKGRSVTVNPDETFSFFCTVSGGQGGVATAQAVDWWGDSSAIAKTTVDC